MVWVVLPLVWLTQLKKERTKADLTPFNYMLNKTWSVPYSSSRVGKVRGKHGRWGRVVVFSGMVLVCGATAT